MTIFLVYSFYPKLNQAKKIAKLVIKKKTKEPIKAPEILDRMVWTKYFDNNPMIITLPQVNKANPWKPIKKSVIAKLNSKAGKYLIPNKAGI